MLFQARALALGQITWEPHVAACMEIYIFLCLRQKVDCVGVVYWHCLILFVYYLVTMCFIIQKSYARVLSQLNNVFLDCLNMPKIIQNKMPLKFIASNLFNFSDNLSFTKL